MDSKEYLINRCKSVLIRDNYCIDNLPLDKEILDILAKTKFLKRASDNSVPFFYTALKDIKEPGILSSEATFQEYGFIIASRRMFPEFVNACIEAAVSAQFLRNMESEKHINNRIVNDERKRKIYYINELRKVRNNQYKELGVVYNLQPEVVAKMIEESDIARDIDQLPLEGASSTTDSSPFSGFIGGIPIAGLLTAVFGYVYGKRRKNKNIMKGMIEATGYFTNILMLLRQRIKFLENNALNAIKIVNGDIGSILSEIDEADYIITKLKFENSFIKNTIDLEKDYESFKTDYESFKAEQFVPYEDIASMPNSNLTNQEYQNTNNTMRDRDSDYSDKVQSKDMNIFGKMLKDAENGDVVALFNLGQVFEYGRLGKKEDHYAARNWYRKAAKNGFVPAQYKLEDMERIIKEEERREDILKRFEVDKEAAERLYNEAWRYEHGIDVPEDLERAKELYRFSALKGNQNAKSRLNFLTRIS